MIRCVVELSCINFYRRGCMQPQRAKKFLHVLAEPPLSATVPPRTRPQGPGGRSPERLRTGATARWRSDGGAEPCCCRKSPVSVFAVAGFRVAVYFDASGYVRPYPLILYQKRNVFFEGELISYPRPCNHRGSPGRVVPGSRCLQVDGCVFGRSVFCPFPMTVFSRIRRQGPVFGRAARLRNVLEGERFVRRNLVVRSRQVPHL